MAVRAFQKKKEDKGRMADKVELKEGRPRKHSLATCCLSHLAFLLLPHRSVQSKTPVVVGGE